MEKKDLLQKRDANLLGQKFRNHTVELTKTSKTTIDPFQLEIQNLEAAEGSALQMPRGVNISKGGELRDIRFFSSESLTIKTTELQFESKRKIPTLKTRRRKI